MAFVLNGQDLDALATGGCFFGSGGGGTLSSAKGLLRHFNKGAYYPADQVTVVTVDEAVSAAEGDAVMVAYMGSPQAINGSSYPEGPVGAAENIQGKLATQGRKLAYIVPPESGALGFVVACLVAVRLGLKVIDADGAGRAVPSLPMLTYAAAAISPRPAVLVSQEGLQVELDVTPRDGENGSVTHQQDVAAIIENMMRPIVAAAQFKEFGGLAMWVMAPEQFSAALPIQGTLSRAVKTGQALAAGELDTAARRQDFLKRESGLLARPIFTGQFKAVEVSTGAGFDVGKMHIVSAEATCTVVYQNESMLAWDSRAAAPLVTAPDSLAYFVSGPGQSVYSNGDAVLADGTLSPSLKDRTVTLFAWQADAALRTPDGQILASFMGLLADMGYLGPYISVEAMQLATAGESRP
ncbi:S-methyl thiohydantoin desulfurase domain-containing protein [Pseudomonas syringae]|uniref:S-methyl thiohydantoin desulfurase domain-containing protein n=1 Tax=Pseudomonas syringae TaxID=317 RepID=UPI0002090D83|nr:MULTISPECIES: DUF917 family protein [Pseudomonas syringae group]EGH96306.1 hypothetical protein PLA106_09557 [Pseudomonas amygdali pv. lachrymans str. M302278]KPC05905.1 Uncharacterized protein AC500_0179 [Pseudomonas amygdali pv. lachrymans]RMM05497.1 hypothetical protein ALQ85_01906 [Pseudomonas syringae]